MKIDMAQIDWNKLDIPFDRSYNCRRRKVVILKSSAGQCLMANQNKWSIDWNHRFYDKDKNGNWRFGR